MEEKKAQPNPKKTVLGSKLKVQVKIKVVSIVIGAVGIAALIVFVVYPSNSDSSSSTVVATVIDDVMDTSRGTEWTLFQSTTDSFEVLMPGEPVIDRQEQDLGSGNIAAIANQYIAADENSNAFIVTVTHYPEGYDVSDAETILKKSVQNAVNSIVDNELMYSKGYIEEKYAMLDAEINNDTQGIYSLQRLILVDRTQYTLLAAFDANNLNNGAEVLYNNFIDSFELMVQ